MKAEMAPTELEVRAFDALRALLGRVSGVRLTEIKRVPQRRSQAVRIVAQVDVFGHRHTLACGVKAPENSRQLRATLRDLHQTACDFAGVATPLLIAPYLSPDAQALCKQSRAAFLDLEGNACLFLGEAFIMMRSLPCGHPDWPAVSLQAANARSAPLKKDEARPADSEHLALIA
jgi:hypothetical protein